jgi:hypothetical protein
MADDVDGMGMPSEKSRRDVPKIDHRFIGGQGEQNQDESRQGRKKSMRLKKQRKTMDGRRRSYIFKTNDE